MPYVMVPVPEEYVEDVMSFILQASARAVLVPWETETLSEFYGEIDEAGRSLLSYVARAMVDGRGLPDAEAAALMELSIREVVGLMREVNEKAREEDHPALIGYRTVTDLLPNGRTTEKRLLTMNEDHTLLVHHAERADRLANPSPLSGGEH